MRFCRFVRASVLALVAAATSAPVSGQGRLVLWQIEKGKWSLVRPAGAAPTASAEIDGDYLPPWDRAVRAGLFVVGEQGASGSFNSFRISYAGR